MKHYEFAAFSGYGVEIEYMIVDCDSLNVRPIADRLLDLAGGADDMDVPRGAANWSNELALHVVEIKTAGPAQPTQAMVDLFSAEIATMHRLLAPFNARLMPTAMHPWMNPHQETKLWPHQNDEIYAAFDAIFDCRGHGWSNVQSTHINFPFSTQDELHRVHSACRIVLPLLPALAASSPFRDAARGPAIDTRLVEYQTNSARIPSVTGGVIPEVCRSEADYSALLEGIYADLRPHDPKGVLAHEWVNSRGAIARFDRGAVEVRLLDTQECPRQDVAIVAFVANLVQALTEGEYGPLARLDDYSTEDLKHLLRATILDGRSARVGEYRKLFGSGATTAAGLLAELTTRHAPEAPALRTGLRQIAEQGNLAERLVARVPRPSLERLRATYAELCACLVEDRAFSP